MRSDPGQLLEESRTADQRYRADHIDQVRRMLMRCEAARGSTALGGAILGALLLLIAFGSVFVLLSVDVESPATPHWVRFFNYVVWGSIGTSVLGLAGHVAWFGLQERIVEQQKRLGIEVRHEEEPVEDQGVRLLAPGSHSQASDLTSDRRSKLEIEHSRESTAEEKVLALFDRYFEKALLVAGLCFLLFLAVAVLKPVSWSAILFGLF